MPQLAIECKRRPQVTALQSRFLYEFQSVIGDNLAGLRGSIATGPVESANFRDLFELVASDPWPAGRASNLPRATLAAVAHLYSV